MIFNSRGPDHYHYHQICGGSDWLQGCEHAASDGEKAKDGNAAPIRGSVVNNCQLCHFNF